MSVLLDNNNLFSYYNTVVLTQCMNCLQCSYNIRRSGRVDVRPLQKVNVSLYKYQAHRHGDDTNQYVAELYL